MTKASLTLAASLLFFPTTYLFASSAEIPVFNVDEMPEYLNIPHIKKEFPGAKDKQQQKQSIEACSNWVRGELEALDKSQVYRFWCDVKADIILREYLVVGHVLIKTWQ